MTLKQQKRIAADILKCGVSRLKIVDQKEVEEAITRQDIRNLIRRGAITKVQAKGTSKAYSKIRIKQKRKGRQLGPGKRRGSFGAKNPQKPKWIKMIRAQRRLLRGLKEDGLLSNKDYRYIYMTVKGGAFRSKSHLLYYLKEQELIKK